MKKLLIALVLGSLLVLALTTIALADNGPHGGFTATTDACAGCHRIHSAQYGDMLLVEADIYLLCVSCHDGTGAYTNVVDGYYDQGSWVAADHGAAPAVTQGDVNQGLFGGGFAFARMMYEWTGVNKYTNTTIPAPKAVTSAHEVEGMAGYTAAPSFTVWGAGDISATVDYGDTWAAGTDLECTSCHDPHGNAGRSGGVATGQPVPTYRLLRFAPDPVAPNFDVTTGPSAAWYIVAGVSSVDGATIADPAVKWYTPNTDATIDPSVKAFRARLSGLPYTVYINGVGDYAGRIYNYQRPAFTVDGVQYVCPDASGNPVVGNTSCANGTAGSIWNNVTPMYRMSLFCAGCHDRYLSTNRNTDTGDAYFAHRHQAMSATFGGCASCHVAHGTAADLQTGYAAAASLAGNSSILLKYTNRGVCLDCHATSVNFPFPDPLVYRP